MNVHETIEQAYHEEIDKLRHRVAYWIGEAVRQARYKRYWQSSFWNGIRKKLIKIKQLNAEIKRLRAALEDSIGVLEACETTAVNEYGMITEQIKEAHRALEDS